MSFQYTLLIQKLWSYRDIKMEDVIFSNRNNNPTHSLRSFLLSTGSSLGFGNPCEGPAERWNEGGGCFDCEGVCCFDCEGGICLEVEGAGPSGRSELFFIELLEKTQRSRAAQN